MAWLWKCFRTYRNFTLLVYLMTCQLVWARNFPQQEIHQGISFQKKQILVGDKKITVQIAETQEQQKLGLMFRKKLKNNHGMLFIFPNESILSFWMKNTYMDLTIGYFNKDQKLLQTVDMAAATRGSDDAPLVSYPSTQPSKYALEMSKDWFKKNKIIIGAKLHL